MQIARISRTLLICAVLFLACVMVPFAAAADGTGTAHVSSAERFVDQALDAAKQGDLDAAKSAYHQFRGEWIRIEDTVKPDSAQAYKDIESQMGQVDYALIQNKQQAIVDALSQLQAVNRHYVEGKYSQDSGFEQEKLTIADFIGLLQLANHDVQKRDQAAAGKAFGKVKDSWLSVEGSVVAQSASVYNDSERDMAVVGAMIKNGDFDGASKRLARMIAYLTPLAGKSGYTMWDAALIPIREGLEALLVVASLLAFVKKSNHGKGKGWIWSGVAGGLLVSAVLAIVVKFVFSSAAFGKNNFLIAGWTGLFAAAMLLYMSYWLHSKSNISEWNRYIRTKSQSALATGSLVSLGFLSFLAVFREGTETVLFIIGMISQISLQDLLLGLLLGFGILAVLAFLMLFVGMKLPIRPFFLVSSLIVFYLSLKFTGLGIHSLQLAGTMPTTLAPHLPSIDTLGFFPSWESAIPQTLLLSLAVAVFVWNRVNTKRKRLAE